MAKVLQVTTPETIDGINLAYDENQQPLTKQTILPLSARKEMERNSAVLPQHLRPTFEEVEGIEPKVPGQDEPDEITVEKLKGLQKLKLQQMYEEVIGTKPDAALNREDLAKAIVDA